MVSRYLIEQGEPVVAYDAQIDYSQLQSVRDRMVFEKGDVLDLPHLLWTIKRNKIDRVVHLAVILHGQDKPMPSYAFQINCTGHLNVLEACILNDIKRLVFTSSKGAFGVIKPPHAPPTFEPVTEDYPRHPVFIYDISKSACEDLCDYYHRNHGLDYITLRFPTLYGPGRLVRHGDIAIVSRLMEGAFRGEPVRLPAQSTWADELLYTGDVARAIHLALYSQKHEHRSFLIGTGQVTPIADLVRNIKELFPAADLEIVPGEVRENRQCRFDISRAQKELGWEAKYPLRQGLEEYKRVLTLS